MTASVDPLQAQLERTVAARDKLAAELVAQHEQLLLRDAAFHAWEEELRIRDDRIAALEYDQTRAGAHIRELTAAIEAIQTTRLWRLGQRYWKLRDRVKGLVERSRL
jgi:hypothetical protein